MSTLSVAIRIEVSPHDHEVPWRAVALLHSKAPLEPRRLTHRSLSLREKLVFCQRAFGFFAR